VNRQEQLQNLLVGLQHEVPDIRGALLASRDGLAIATTMPAAEGGRVAAMAATVAALANRVVDTIGLGHFEETEIQGDAGTFIVYDAGHIAVLAVLAQRGATLGLVHLEARRVADEVGKVLAAYRDEQRAASAAAASAPETATPSTSPRPEAAPPAAAPMASRQPAYQAASA